MAAHPAWVTHLEGDTARLSGHSEQAAEDRQASGADGAPWLKLHEQGVPLGPHACGEQALCSGSEALLQQVREDQSHLQAEACGTLQ